MRIDGIRDGIDVANRVVLIGEVLQGCGREGLQASTLLVPSVIGIVLGQTVAEGTAARIVNSVAEPEQQIMFLGYFSSPC